jgi:hypothetical protein
MTERTKYTFNVEPGLHGMWYATSPNVKGLLVAEQTLAACLSEIAPAMEKIVFEKEAELRRQIRTWIALRDVDQRIVDEMSDD